MKTVPENIRASAIQGTMRRIKIHGVEAIIYELTMKEETFFNSRVVRNFEEFKRISDVIVAKRWEEAPEIVKEKVFTRALFGRDL